MTASPSPFSLEDVVINSELLRRACRPPDYEAENEALRALIQTMAEAPQMILQTLVETARRLCRADTAGISLLEQQNGEQVFRWEALAGVYADRLNNTMPRNASPCGTTIDRNTSQLMYMAERFFPALKAEPPVVEALLIPFHVKNQPIGTVWVVAHDEHRKFDREDERIVKTLAQFASASWQLWQQTRKLAAANEELQLQMSERKRADQSLTQLNEQLERIVLDRTRELEAVHRRLGEIQVIGAIGTAAAKIIHEMADPLNAISVLVQLQERYVKANSERLHVLFAETTNDLKTETDRVRALIEELRQFSRPLQLKREPLDLAKLLAEVMQETIFISGNVRSVEIERQLAEDPPLVMADNEKLTRVILNLCKNAFEAMPNGGKLILRCYPRGTNVCIEVQDSGNGIPKDLNVFEAFTTSKPNGWGLGLAIAKQIVSLHNGTIEYVSEPGKGTTFTICLPIAAASSRF